MAKTLQPKDYHLAWVSPLLIEQDASKRMLDSVHPPLECSTPGAAGYVLGDIAGHNIVMLGQPTTGNLDAGKAVTRMKEIFTNLRIGLLVGIGGGVPVTTEAGNLRLGDIVVSKPTTLHPGVVRYDRGKEEHDGFKITEQSLLAPPSTVLLAVQRVDEGRSPLNDPVYHNMRRLDTLVREPRRFQFPGRQFDFLFRDDYIHLHPRNSCSDCGCDFSQIITRQSAKPPSRETYVTVHHGTIASGDRIIKNACERDRLATELGAYCFETEAAGVLSELECLVIRGISDYCDSHKNNQWHGYAAGNAAAYARAIIAYLPRATTTTYHLPPHSDQSFRQIITAWLSPADYGPHQRYLRAAATDGLGQYVTTRTEFREWVNTQGRTLVLIGDAGTGRTITTSWVVRYLQTRFLDDSEVGIAYIYFGYEPQYESLPIQVLLSLTRQLVAIQRYVPLGVKSLYSSHRGKSTWPSYPELFRVLSAIASEYSKMFFLLDGIYETDMQEADKQRLMETLMALQTNANINLFLTVDVGSGIRPVAGHATIITMPPGDAQMSIYYEKEKSRLPEFILNDASTQQRVKETVLELARIRFLKASLYFNLMCMSATLRDAHSKSDINVWPSKKYDDFYTALIQAIKEQPRDNRALSGTVLMWLSYTSKPLLLAELQNVYNRDPSKTHELKSALDASTLARLCAGLVAVNEESGLVGWVHTTARAYFQENKSHLFLDGERRIATICMANLTMEPPEPNRGLKMGRERVHELNSIQNYSTHNWGHHACRSSLDGSDTIVTHLRNDNTLRASGKAIVAPNDWNDYSPVGYQEDVPSNITNLHLAAFFGLSGTINRLLQPNQRPRKSLLSLAWDIIYQTDSFIDCIDTVGRTPLSFAAEKGHLDILCMLLEGGADLNCQDKAGRNSLAWGARGGHYEVVAELLKRGAEINSKDQAGRTALSWAAASGDERVVRHLLAHGALLDPSERLENSVLGKVSQWFQQKPKLSQEVTYETRGVSPLLRASCNGHDRVVEMLLDAGAHSDDKDDEARTGLSWAASNGHDATIQLLLRAGANRDAPDCNQRTPLSWASGNGHIAIVVALIHGISSLDAKDSNGMTALSQAASAGQRAIVDLLIENGADPRFTDNSGKTAFIWASANAHRAVADLLLSRDNTQLDDSDPSGRTALSWAAGNGSYSVVEFLISRGASIQVKGNATQSPLFCAARSGHRAMVEFLLHRGGEDLLNVKDGFGGSALTWAAQMGHLDVVRLLVSRDKYGLLETPDSYGMTALSLACQNGHESVAKEILNVNTILSEQRNNKGQTPLILAASNRRDSVVQILLEHRAIVDARDNSGNTSLAIAAAAGSKSMVELLMRANADPNTYVQGHRTPFMLAVDNGHSAVVETMLQRGANVNARDNTRRTPLFAAVKRKSLPLVQLLLKHKAAPNARNNKGQTVLFPAVKDNHNEIVQLLLKAKATVNIRDLDGATPMSLACALGERGARVQTLLRPLFSNYFDMSPETTDYSDYSD